MNGFSIALRKHLWRPIKNAFGLAIGRYLKAPDNKRLLNPGDQNTSGFFVDLDACIACGVCKGEAPGFFDFVDGKYGSHVLRQPKSNEDLDAFKTALEFCCVDAIYYGGDDARVRAMVDSVTSNIGRPKFTTLGSLAKRLWKP